MNLYSVDLAVRSPLITPPTAEVLFGHLCWTLRYREGNSVLEEWLAGFEDGEPLLVLSDLFPAGWLPLPQLRYPEKCDVKGKPSLQWVREEDVRSGEILKLNLRERMTNGLEAGDWPRRVSAQVAHNRIDRRTGGTPRDGGGLFHFREWLWVSGKENRPLDVRLYFLAEEPEWLLELLTEAVHNGFGADAGVGRGVMAPLRDTLRAVDWPDLGGRRLALGGFFPRPGECHDLRAVPRVRFGRLGGHYASGATEQTGTHRPFKKPVVLMSAGATCEPGPERWCGQLLGGVHVDSRICHHALAPLVPLGVDEEGGDSR